MREHGIEHVVLIELSEAGGDAMQRIEVCQVLLDRAMDAP